MPPESSTSLTWYVALVRSGHEKLAEEHLLSSGFLETFCPRRVSIRQVRGKATEDVRSVFGGYVLVAVDLFTDEMWHLACPEDDRPNHGLVKSFIGGWPVDPVPIQSVLDLRSCCDINGVWVEPLEPGIVIHPPNVLLRITSGPYVDRIVKVIVDKGDSTLKVYAVQGAHFTIYIQRERVEAINQETVRMPRYRRGLRRYTREASRSQAAE